MTRLHRSAPDLRRWFWGALLLAGIGTACGAEWIRADNHQPVWGAQGGLQFAISPGGFTTGNGGPRGLIRIGYPTLTNGGYDLINFIAVEPVVGGARGYSELEKSQFDGQQGKVFRASAKPGANGVANVFDPGKISSPLPGVEELSVSLNIEKFDNGAHVNLTLSQRSDAPDEVCLTVNAEPDSAPIQFCILTATMGNKARARLLWLRDGPVSSRKIFGDYTGSHFTRHESFPLTRLPRTANGDVLIAITTDEDNPASVLGLGGWEYRGEQVTQFWRQPAFEVDDSLRCVVNARFKYWMSERPVPNGLAFENFELLEKFHNGQQFIFGVTKRQPGELLKR